MGASSYQNYHHRRVAKMPTSNSLHDVIRVSAIDNISSIALIGIKHHRSKDMPEVVDEVVDFNLITVVVRNKAIALCYLKARQTAVE